MSNFILKPIKLSCSTDIQVTLQELRPMWDIQTNFVYWFEIGTAIFHQHHKPTKIHEYIAFDERKESKTNYLQITIIFIID